MKILSKLDALIISRYNKWHKSAHPLYKDDMSKTVMYFIIANSRDNYDDLTFDDVDYYLKLAKICK